MLILTPDRNVHRRDYSIVFGPEAERYKRALDNHGKLSDRFNSTIHKINVARPMARRRAQTLDIIDSVPSGTLDGVTFFMHGWPKGIQCGFRLNDAKTFVDHLVPKLRDGVGTAVSMPLIINLFCCLTGDVPGSGNSDAKKLGPGGDGGFADRVRDELCRAGYPWVKVYAHTTKGHSTRNPFVRVMHGDGSPVGGDGGRFAIPPPKRGAPSPMWKAWKAALWTTKGSRWQRGQLLFGGSRKDFRFLAPFMTTAELHAELINTKR